MKKLLTPFVTLMTIMISTAAMAGDSNRSFQQNKDALLDFELGGKPCSRNLFSLTIDGGTACSNIPNTYLYKKELVNSDGSRTKTKEVREFTDSYSEKASISPDGTESLEITITSKISADTNIGTSRNISLDDLTNIFGNAETASKLRQTMSHGLAAARRSHQEPVEAPESN